MEVQPESFNYMPSLFTCVCLYHVSVYGRKLMKSILNCFFCKRWDGKFLGVTWIQEANFIYWTLFISSFYSLVLHIFSTLLMTTWPQCLHTRICLFSLNNPSSSEAGTVKALLCGIWLARCSVIWHCSEVSYHTSEFLGIYAFHSQRYSQLQASSYCCASDNWCRQLLPPLRLPQAVESQLCWTAPKQRTCLS